MPSWIFVQYHEESKVPIWVGTVVPEPSKINVFASRSDNVGVVNVHVNSMGSIRRDAIPIYGFNFSPEREPGWATALKWPILVRVWNVITQFVNVFAQFTPVERYATVQAQLPHAVADAYITGLIINEPVREITLFAYLLETEWEYKLFWEVRGEMTATFLTGFYTVVKQEQIDLFVHTMAPDVNRVLLNAAVMEGEQAKFAQTMLSVINPELLETIQMSANVMSPTLTETIQAQVHTLAHEQLNTMQMKAEISERELNETTQMKVDTLTHEITETTQLQVITREEHRESFLTKVEVHRRYLEVKALMKVHLVTPYLGPILNLLDFKLRWNWIVEKRSRVFGHINKGVQEVARVVGHAIGKTQQYTSALIGLGYETRTYTQISASVEFNAKSLTFVTAAFNHLAYQSTVNAAVNDTSRFFAVQAQMNDVTRRPAVQAAVNHIKRTPWIHADPKLIQRIINVVFSSYPLTAVLYVNFDVLTIVKNTNILLDLLPLPYHYPIRAFMDLHQIDELKFLNFTFNEVNLSTKVQMTVYRVVVRALVQWFLHRGSISNEGSSNEIIFDLNAITPIVPQPPGVGGDWEGGYVEYPFYGMGFQSSQEASGWSSPEADRWVKNATMFWNKAQDVFDE